MAYTLKINNLIPVKKATINTLDTTAFTSSYQIVASNKPVIFSEVTNASNFHLDPTNNTHIICDISGIYSMNFPMVYGGNWYLFINNTHNAIFSGSSSFNGINLNEGDYIYFEYVTNSGVHTSVSTPFIITQQVIPITTFESSYEESDINKTVTFSNVLNGSNFQIDPSNNTHIICNTSDTYDMQFESNTDYFYLALYINSTYVCAAQKSFTGIKVDQGDHIYFSVVNNSTKYRTIGPQLSFKIYKSNTTSVYCM